MLPTWRLPGEGSVVVLPYPFVKSLCYAVGDHEIVVQELVTVKNWGTLP